MHESVMAFSLSFCHLKKRSFAFKDMWDKADKSLIPKIFHPDFTFRGSLGPVLRGHAQFAGYVDMVTSAE